VLVVMFRLMLCRFFRVLGGKDLVAVRKMGVMPGFFMGTRLMVLALPRDDGGQRARDVRPLACDAPHLRVWPFS
jgi:hypothetical protein